MQYLRKAVIVVILVTMTKSTRIIGPGITKLTIEPMLAPMIAAGKVSVIILKSVTTP